MPGCHALMGFFVLLGSLWLSWLVMGRECYCCGGLWFLDGFFVLLGSLCLSVAADGAGVLLLCGVVGS